MTPNLLWPDEIAETISGQSDLILCIGKLLADELHHLSRPLVQGGHVPAERVLRAGGAPANVTSLLALNDQPSRMAGWVGEDPIAKGLVADLHRRGVEITCKIQGRSPKSTTLIDQTGERSLIADTGDGTLLPEDIKASWFEGAAAVHLDGYDLMEERFPDAVLTAAKMARERNLVLSVEVGAANRILELGVDAYLSMLEELRPHVLFANEDEAKALRLRTQRLPWLPLLVVHRGSLSTFVSTRSENRQYAVPKLDIVDSTGCGDAFAAGFLSGLVKRLSMYESVARGHTWAGHVSKVIGAQLPHNPR